MTTAPSSDPSETFTLPMLVTVGLTRGSRVISRWHMGITKTGHIKCRPLTASKFFDFEALVAEAELAHHSAMAAGDDELFDSVPLMLLPEDNPPKANTRELSGTASRKSHRNYKRDKARQESLRQYGHQSKDRTIREHVQLCEPIVLDINAADYDVDSSGYQVKRSTETRQELEATYTLSELVDMGFEVVEWDGREARPLLDSTGRICAVLAGQPFDSTYRDAVDRASELMSAEAQTACYRAHETRHRRGPFPAVAFGLSYGGGQMTAQRLSLGSLGPMVDRIMAHEDIKRIASYADSAFQLWAPRLHAYYRETLLKVLKKTGQRANFEGSAYAATSVNLGDRVCCYKHRDCVNLAFGWCAITALGKFDATKGGHFVIWELKMVIEFPSGATLLMPSAAFHHSNSRTLGVGEIRQSITQYTAGGIFRWVENGFMSEERLLASDKKSNSPLPELVNAATKKYCACMAKCGGIRQVVSYHKYRMHAPYRKAEGFSVSKALLPIRADIAHHDRPPQAKSLTGIDRAIDARVRLDPASANSHGLRLNSARSASGHLIPAPPVTLPPPPLTSGHDANTGSVMPGNEPIVSDHEVPHADAVAELPASEAQYSDRLDTAMTSKIPEIQDSLDFRRALEDASLDNGDLSSEQLARLRDPKPRVEFAEFDRDALLSIKFFLSTTTASDAVYDNIRRDVEETHQQKLLSHKQVKQEISNLTGVQPIVHDMCPKSCMAYTSPWSSLTHCRFCQTSRLDPATMKPQQQFYTMPLGPQLQARWSHATNANLMEHRKRETEKIFDSLRSPSSQGKIDK
ncbi:hypothetical protein CVT24_007572 [Panaeolus cyanescens]|uniref:Uncharacterized protein n=1 Tax=Panaeolus cyanescens TaxID=181874 RepID=A0A409YWN7_9AGAR|nr:hypothetical protein CVT24_007572 [Panaeolus cyanescens]